MRIYKTDFNKYDSLITILLLTIGLISSYLLKQIFGYILIAIVFFIHFFKKQLIDFFNIKIIEKDEVDEK